MASNKKKWNTPKLTAFYNFEEAATYYEKRNQPQHAEAIKGLWKENHRLIDERQVKRSTSGTR